jgi:NaMN:DMB phosphoribosyltransferase
MVASDALVIQRQASQRVQLGLERDMTIEEADSLIEDGEAWTAIADERIVACMGLRETFPGRQAVAWAILAEGVGGAHLAVTRFARRRIAQSRLARIEAIVRAAVPAECAWAKLVGLQAAHVLRCFGAQSETHVLYERVREAG